MTIPCDGNVCFAGSEHHNTTSNDIAEASSGSDLDRQIESIRASVDLQVRWTESTEEECACELTCKISFA
jgi:hypothetical protein